MQQHRDMTLTETIARTTTTNWAREAVASKAVVVVVVVVVVAAAGLAVAAVAAVAGAIVEGRGGGAQQQLVTGSWRQGKGVTRRLVARIHRLRVRVRGGSRHMLVTGAR